MSIAIPVLRRQTILIRRSSGQVILEVKDNGRGMEQEMLDRFREAGTGDGRRAYEYARAGT